MEQKIVPNLWFEGNAREAVDYYISIFPDSRDISVSNYPLTAEEGLADFQQPLAGDVLTIEFELAKYRFTAINAGPEFKPTAATAFMLNFDPSQDENAETHLNELWESLIDGGEALMPLDAYPFSKRYGWVRDRYGYTWQLILTDPEGDPRPFIIPSLMFSGANANHAEEAMNFYTSVFKDTKIGVVAKYEGNEGPAKAGSIMFADFTLAGQWFTIMDTNQDHDIPFTEAISFVVLCNDQEEIDYYWENLSSVAESEQCGWCKDKYGVSWQIVPRNIEALMSKPGAYARMMEMKKLVIADF